MKVTHVITFAEYWGNPTVFRKRPDTRSARAIDRYGGALYQWRYALRQKA